MSQRINRLVTGNWSYIYEACQPTDMTSVEIRTYECVVRRHHDPSPYNLLFQLVRRCSTVILIGVVIKYILACLAKV